MSRRSLPAVIAAVAVSAFAVPGAQAATTTPASCGYAGYAQPFLPWADSSSYAPIPNGGFESGTTGWTLTNGAALVTPGNPVLGGGSGYGLNMPAGSTATTAPICVETGLPYIRLFGWTTVINPKYAASLKVELLYTNTRGQNVVQTLKTQSNLTAYKPTDKISLPSPDSIKPDSTNHLWVRYRLTPLYSTHWQIDDIWIDPKKH